MKTAIITGATSGMGQAIAGQLRVQGWEVVGLTRAQFDLGDLDQVAAEALELASVHSKVDALIHVAGVWHDDEQALANRDLEDFSAEQISDAMNVGVTSFMILAAAILPSLTKSGAVIGISGTFSSGASGRLPYYTSKRALEDFLVGLAEDYPNGPRIFGVSPSDTATAAYKKFYPEDAAAQAPELVADVVAQLASGKLAAKTGEIIKVRAGKPGSGYHK